MITCIDGKTWGEENWGHAPGPSLESCLKIIIDISSSVTHSVSSQWMHIPRT